MEMKWKNSKTNTLKNLIHKIPQQLRDFFSLYSYYHLTQVLSLSRKKKPTKQTKIRTQLNMDIEELN
jgi:hypothetical protein